MSPPDHPIPDQPNDAANGEAGRARAMLSVLEDLHAERQRLAGEIEQRRAAEARFRATIESAPTAMVMIDGDGIIVLVNAETEKLFGYPRDELVGQPVELLVPTRFRPEHPAHRAGYVADPAPRRMGAGRDLFGLRKDGSEFPVEIGVSPVQTHEGLFVLSAIADITERKRLETAQRQLNEELERRVAERTAELARSNEALEQSNVELQQFAYIASHDLQTPLRAIAGFAQFLQQDYQDQLDENANERIDRIVQGAKRMQQLITDLLTFSRVQSRSRPFEPTDLNELFDDAVTLLRASIDDAGGEVTRGPLPTVNGDCAQLSLLLQNLIGNALKYQSHAPPRIHVSAELRGGVWTIAVRDNGIGINAKHHERIFEIFRRLHTQDKYPGTGIGLAVCRRIVHRHGGKIWLTSKLARGSTFYFTIPERAVETPG